MDGNTRICKKCLLREMDEAGFFQNMYDYIARIPADDKTPEEEYERRLSICIRYIRKMIFWQALWKRSRLVWKTNTWFRI